MYLSILKKMLHHSIFSVPYRGFSAILKTYVIPVRRTIPMANRCTRIPEIMMPREGTDLSKWAVIACDQYTSQPEYWAETDRIVGDAPSTLRLTLRTEK